MLLADLLPERRVRLLAIGQQGITAQVLCAIHYPSDVEAGQRLESAAVEQILSSDQ
ncbi:PA-phosphatasee related phosphoesterase [Prochlorococcus sp. MIT 0702]|nr:PA-phosphatasee related phosphoesterase [Prochlorococcus sp. MIT 0702]